MNIVMQRGKHSVAQGIVYGAFEQMEEKQGSHALEILERAVENIKPRLEVKSRRVGGATYQVPLEVSGDRSEALALRWMVGFAKSRKGTPMRQALAKEILEAYEGEGPSIRGVGQTPAHPGVLDPAEVIEALVETIGCLVGAR